MPLSSQTHVPTLMGEDEHSIKYGVDAELFEADGRETKETEGVVVTMARRKADGAMGVLSCEFKKALFDQEKAGAWLAAQRFSLEPADLHSVTGVEIFSTGLWNGKQITEADLDAIAEAYAATKGMVSPALKLGHDDGQKLLQADGLPAAGWVENVRRVGSKLVADLVDIPKKIFQLIRNKGYRKVSCEIYNNVDIQGAKYPKLLGAVSLLGADLPGVLNLSDILSLYSTNGLHVGVENFRGEGAVDILSSVVTNHREGEMPQENPQDNFKAELDQTKAALDAAKAEAEKYKKEAEDAKKSAEDAAKAANAAKIDSFVSGLKAEKLCSPSMEPKLKAFLTEQKESYSFDGKDVAKLDLVKDLLKLAAENGKVNFSQTTADGEDGKKPDDDLNKKVEKYAADNKVSYSAAYRAVTRGMNLDAKPMVQEDRGSDA